MTDQLEKEKQTIAMVVLLAVMLCIVISVLVWANKKSEALGPDRSGETTPRNPKR